MSDENTVSEPTVSTVDAEVVDADAAFVMPTYARYPVEFVSGHDATLVDSTGREYIDLLGGIGCVSLGHCNPIVADAVRDQLGRVWQTSNYFYDATRAELAAALSSLLSTTTDEGGHVMGSTGTRWKTFFANSGAEANEGAFKLARRWGEKNLDGASVIVSARQSFHGRTLATLAATGQDRFHRSFRPLPEGFVALPLNDIYALRERIERGGVCAVILECVQGEGGVWNANYDYMRDVRELCREKGVLMIVDEVQTGFFRCGSPFCFQRCGIEPDVVSMAKGIADGFPMGAVAARADVADLLAPGDHGSTFGGNQLACAAGLACVNALVDLGIGEHVLSVGRHLRHRLSAMDHVVEVRGHGLMRGAELDVPVAARAVEAGLAEGLVLNHIGDSILRFLPPLVITCAEVDDACDRLERVIARLA
ncbi:aminotransferase class III-fold pyridoxal phosphate-dependent enzyme [Thermophilibacter mediterraneus]|uniref:aminotransferase class III-fold pyridoxal phosphate-dependent enzyme n=1 Tax=Thermophilibacter mediterraneus TaxID=1871031 RepID=UPI0009313A29|nr:aminotransferase class III-fold pyridoxal phosphate-dependent enzyme [Thermophilibacter mediterraneus]